MLRGETGFNTIELGYFRCSSETEARTLVFVEDKIHQLEIANLLRRLETH